MIQQRKDEVQKRMPAARVRVAQPTVEWCLPLHYLPEPATRPVTALASAPGSGNTWLRYLLQQASGTSTFDSYRVQEFSRETLCIYSSFPALEI